MKKIVYVDMDNVLVDFPYALEREPAGTRAEYGDRADEIPGIFARMPPMPGALESFAELAERFDTYVLSTAPWENRSAWSDKLDWVKEHLGKAAYKRLILTHHKNLNIGDYLIDDRLKNGAGAFGGKHLQFGIEPYADWSAVMAYMRRVEP